MNSGKSVPASATDMIWSEKNSTMTQCTNTADMKSYMRNDLSSVPPMRDSAS